MTQPGGERRGMEKAMSTSVERLHREAQRLIDELGPTEPPARNDGFSRKYSFCEEAIVGAGFEPDAEVYVVDSPITDEDPEDDPVPAMVTLFYVYKDDEIYRSRDTSLLFLPDGRIVADEPLEVVRPRHQQRPKNEDELLMRAAKRMAAQPGPEIFTQAECDQWLKLITLEFAQHGLS